MLIVIIEICLEAIDEVIQISLILADQLRTIQG